jgi:hypothetical protein
MASLVEVLLEMVFLAIIPAIIALSFSFYFFSKKNEYKDIVDTNSRGKMDKYFKYIIGVCICFIIVNILLAGFSTGLAVAFFQENISVDDQNHREQSGQWSGYQGFSPVKGKMFCWLIRSCQENGIIKEAKV